MPFETPQPSNQQQQEDEEMLEQVVEDGDGAQQAEGEIVGLLRDISNNANSAELKLFLEVATGEDLQPITPRTKEYMLLFFKLYDPSKQKLCYVGRLFVKGTSKPVEILSKLNEMVNFAPEEEIELYEEVKFEPRVLCALIDKTLTFSDNKLEDGDIICFQKVPQVSERFSYPNFPSFLKYVHNRQVVRFQAFDRAKDDHFCLELSKLHTYDDVVERVSQHLGLEDPSRIRLTSHNCYSQQPTPEPIKYRGAEHLSDMLSYYNQTSDILYYEVLDIPLPELQGLKILKVYFHSAVKNEVITLVIRLPKQSTVQDVLNDLNTKVSLSHPDAELRLLEVLNCKIYKIFLPGEIIDNINDRYWIIRAEEILGEERNLGPNDRLIHVNHFTKYTVPNKVQNFGVPFLLVIHDGETLVDIKARIQKKLQIPDEDFSKWKFAFVTLGLVDYLEDNEVVFTCYQRRDVLDAWEQYLGLEHTDNTSKMACAASQDSHDRPFRIYN